MTGWKRGSTDKDVAPACVCDPEWYGPLCMDRCDCHVVGAVGCKQPPHPAPFGRRSGVSDG